MFSLLHSLRAFSKREGFQEGGPGPQSGLGQPFSHFQPGGEETRSENGLHGPSVFSNGTNS